MSEAPPLRPRATRAGRLLVYVNRMFTPAVLVPVAAAAFAAVDFSIQALAGRSPIVATWRSVAGAASVLLFMLLMRVQDELKDVETDLVLGKAGDPRYKDRPIVTGEIFVEDLVFLRWSVVAGLVLLNAPLGFPLPFAAFAGALGLMWLSFHWFFWPAIKRSLLLAFATHNPLTLAVSCYVVAVSAGHAGGTERLTVWTAPLVVGLWMAVAAWETSRKVRLPQDETDYVTYSKVLGWKTAALAPAFFVALSAGLLAPVARAAGLGWVFVAVLLAAAAVPVGACLLLRLAPSSARTNLRPFAEAYTVVANTGLAVALAARHGVALA